MVHTCPRCELRFERESELRFHLQRDHDMQTEGFEPLRYEGRSARSAPGAARRFLVVANQTLHANELEARIRELAGLGPARFNILVPAEPRGGESADDARRLAEHRLHHLIELLHADGIAAEGEIGVADPFQAIEDVLEWKQFDEIVLSTLPPSLSRWMAADLPRRLERNFHLPVTRVEATV
jgi:GABA permease